MINTILSGLGVIAKPVAKVFTAREQRKTTVETIKAKTLQGKQQGETSVALSHAEWEVVGQMMQGASWKDEFVTVIVFAPFITSLLGALLAAFGYPELADASAHQLKAIASMNIDYGNLLMVVASAAIGLRFIRR